MRKKILSVMFITIMTIVLSVGCSKSKISDNLITNENYDEETSSMFEETKELEISSSTEDIINTDETSNDFTELDNLTSGSNSIESSESTTKDENNSTTKKETTENNKETTSKPASTTKPSTVKPTTTKKENTTTKKEETTTAKPEVVWVEPSYGKAVTTKPAVNYEDYGWVKGQMIYTSIENYNYSQMCMEYWWIRDYKVETKLAREWYKYALKISSWPEKRINSENVGENIVQDIWVCLDGFEEYYDDPEHGTVIVLGKDSVYKTVHDTGNYSSMGKWSFAYIEYEWSNFENKWYTYSESFQRDSIPDGYNDFVKEKVYSVILDHKPKINGKYDGEIARYTFYVWVEY